jgi:hypothetical protein
MTWPPLRPLLGWQRPLAPHRMRHRENGFVAFVTNRVHGSMSLECCQHPAKRDVSEQSKRYTV